MDKNNQERGRPLKFNITHFKEAETNFFKYCEDNDLIPDVEELAVYLDTTRKTLWEYEDYPEFSNTIKKIKTKIASCKKQLAMKGKIPPAVFCFDFKNNHEYKDKSEIDNIQRVVMMGNVKVENGKDMEFDIGDQDDDANTSS